jgi:hypothetical protein
VVIYSTYNNNGHPFGFFVAWADGSIDTLEAKEPLTGIEKKEKAARVQSQQLVVYPNPVNNELHILFGSEISSQAELGVYDLKGALVMPVQTMNAHSGLNETTLNVSSLSPGFYFVQLKSGDRSIQKKLLVN